MSDETPNLSLPFIQPAQAQKHVTHNEAIERLDVVVQLTLVTQGATVPPFAPNEGEAYGVGVSPTGDWAGQGDSIATWRGGGWLFVAPRDGWVAWVADDSLLQVRDGGVWVTLATGGGPGQVGDLLHLTPGTAPGTPQTGDVYFDAGAAKLRCYDGAVWQDLF